jgi:hypothetical protein
MRASWADLAGGKDVYGEKVAYEDYTGKRPMVSDLGNEIKISGFEGMSTTEMTAWIMDAYNVSKTYAEMMLADFKNYSIDLATELKANDFSEGMEKAYDRLHTIERTETVRTRGGPVAQDVEGNVAFDPQARSTKNVKVNYSLIDETEIQALMEYWGQSRDTVLKALESHGKVFVTDFYDDEGVLKETTELLAEVGRIY